ncbi:MAG: EpsG family protein [Clostridia bacterium]|nr:EpsG family protein [Clostridia bacterium]
MLTYFGYVLSPIIIAFFFNAREGHPHVNATQRTKRDFLIICGVIMFLMIALRSQYIGSEDASRYYANWEEISKTNLSGMEQYVEDSRMEPVFLYTLWVLSRVFIPAQFIFVFSGALFTVAVCRFVYKNSEDVVLSMSMYNTLGLFGFMIQGMRQSIAMSICLFAIEMCKERKLWRFTALILLASLYHRSAIFMLVIYPFFGLRLNMKTCGIVAASCAALVASSGFLIRVGNEMVQANYGNTVESGGLIATLIYVLILFAGFLLSGNKRYEESFSFFVIFTIFGMLLYIMRYFGTQVMERVSFYFMFGQLIVLPGTLRTFDKGWRQWSTLGIMAVCFLLAVYRNAGSALVPYDFFWQVR